jgi:hypothetical protein
MLITKKVKKRTIDDEIDRIMLELETMQSDSKEYETKVKQVEALSRSRSYKAANLVSTDTLVTAGVNILGILLILNYENLHVVSSKALGFVLKCRA